jgi:hypothetical protein
MRGGDEKPPSLAKGAKKEFTIFKVWREEGIFQP